MPTTSMPFGLRPIRTVGGAKPPMVQELPNGLSAAYGTSIYQYQPVKRVASGYIEPISAASDLMVGVFMGCTYADATTKRQVVSNKWTAGTAFVAGSLTVYYTEDPEIIYEIQADGSLTQAGVGAVSDFTNITSGDSTTGFSQMTLNSTPKTGQGQFRIMRLSEQPTEEWGNAYTIVQGVIAEHQDLSRPDGI